MVAVTVKGFSGKIISLPLEHRQFDALFSTG